MISLARVDDRIIRGQIITRWSKGYPCGGIIAMNDKAATASVLRQLFVASANKKVLVWTKKHFLEEVQTVLDSGERYFLITKNPVDMKELLVGSKFVPSDVKHAVIGPCNDCPGATKLGQNQSIIRGETEVYEAMTDAGYDVLFILLGETVIGSWPKFKSRFGYQQIGGFMFELDQINSEREKR